MEKEVKTTIFKTLIYGDIFNYPLTKEEIWRFLISVRSIDRALLEKALTAFPPGGWEHKKDLFFLLGRVEIVEKRIERKKESEKKLEIASKIIQKLSIIPTVLLIGISGGLALENAEEKDDIDLFVITSKNTLWITRLFLIFLLILMGQYRGRGKKKSQKVCLNMLIDEEALTFQNDRQNLYTAHEIVQLKPVFERSDIYQKFINANKWVEEFLPNAIGRIKNPHFAEASRGKHELVIKERKNPLFIMHYSLFILEKIAKFLQLKYMQKHRTTETVSNHLLAFHPFEYKDYVLKEYNKRLRQYK